jgi:hypothetical protein
MLRTRQRLAPLLKILRGIDPENTFFSQSTYITRAFKIRRGDANFGVSYEFPKSCLTLSVCYN